MEQYLYPLIGGVVIGVSSTTMLGGLGRITGITGIFDGALSRPEKSGIWRYTFLLGLILGGIIMYNMAPQFFNYKLEASPLKTIAAGLLVGYGTRLGSGCTSGHGVCGLSRTSKRSLVATITFIGFGVITVAVVNLIKGAM